MSLEVITSVSFGVQQPKATGQDLLHAIAHIVDSEQYEHISDLEILGVLEQLKAGITLHIMEENC